MLTPVLCESDALLNKLISTAISTLLFSEDRPASALLTLSRDKTLGAGGKSQPAAVSVGSAGQR